MYLLPDEQPVANWMTADYDDLGWNEGPSGFGYSDGDDNTLVPATTSIYIRHEFDLSSLDDIEAGVFNMDYDDGFAAYLNGVEIARENLGEPGETIAWDATLDADHEAVLYSGGYPDTYVLDDFALLLTEGSNTLAVEIHNVGLFSSDLTARPFLHVGYTVEETIFSDTPDWFIPPSELCDDPNYTVVLSTGGWGNEFGWELLTLDGVLIDEGLGYDDYATFELPVCLADDCYQFNMIDTYGDGWNGGAFHILNESDITEIHHDFIKNYFLQVISPALVIIILNEEVALPELKDSAAYLTVKMSNTNGNDRFALIEISKAMDRFIVLPSVGDSQYIIMVDNILRYCLDDIFNIFDLGINIFC